VVPQAARRDRVEMGRLDRAAVATEMTEPSVVENDEHDVRSPLLRPDRCWPRRAGLLRGAPDHSWETVLWVVLNDRHQVISPVVDVRARTTSLDARPDRREAVHRLGMATLSHPVPRRHHPIWVNPPRPTPCGSVEATCRGVPLPSPRGSSA